jgi:hypothetical protein
VGVDGVGGAGELDVVDFAMAFVPEGGADVQRHIGQPGHIVQFNLFSVIAGDEKPVATPGDVALHQNSIHLYPDVLCFYIALDVLDGDSVSILHRDLHHAYGCLDAMLANGDLAEVEESDGDAHHSVAAHAEVADVVEEDDAGGASFIVRLEQYRPDHYFRAARLVNQGGAHPVVLLAKGREFVSDAAAAQVGSPADDDARWLTRGVRLDDPHSCIAFSMGLMSIGASLVRFSQPFFVTTTVSSHLT